MCVCEQIWAENEHMKSMIKGKFKQGGNLPNHHSFGARSTGIVVSEQSESRIHAKQNHSCCYGNRQVLTVVAMVTDAQCVRRG